MASLPAALPKSSPDLSQPDPLDGQRWYVIEGLEMGMDVAAIAKRAYPRSAVKRKAFRRRIREWARFEQRFQQMVAISAQGEMVLGLKPATAALARRAAKGRPDAIKLLFEASQFHNPRVKHEHSGDIKVTLDIPRPARVEQDDIVDADVVEE